MSLVIDGWFRIPLDSAVTWLILRIAIADGLCSGELGITLLIVCCARARAGGQDMTTYGACRRCGVFRFL